MTVGSPPQIINSFVRSLMGGVIKNRSFHRAIDRWIDRWIFPGMWWQRSRPSSLSSRTRARAVTPAPAPSGPKRTPIPPPALPPSPPALPAVSSLRPMADSQRADDAEDAGAHYHYQLEGFARRSLRSSHEQILVLGYDRPQLQRMEWMLLIRRIEAGAPPGAPTKIRFYGQKGKDSGEHGCARLDNNSGELHLRFHRRGGAAWLEEEARHLRPRRTVLQTRAPCRQDDLVWLGRDGHNNPVRCWPCAVFRCQAIGSTDRLVKILAWLWCTGHAQYYLHARPEPSPRKAEQLWGPALETILEEPGWKWQWLAGDPLTIADEGDTGAWWLQPA